MSEKDLSYRLTADSRGFERGFKSAEASARALERELARLEAEQARVDAALAEVGQTALIAGGAIAAGLAMATKSAISWESAWTGVAKVIDGSPEQLAVLEEELRGLARTLPQTHEEIAGVAAAAGQLGIAREHITGFTKVMVDLGVATNLTSEDAAFALSRLMNIMQTAPDDVDRLGASIVALGNNSATTEADIVEMALRISGAGKTVRMSEADVLGYAAALSSVGVQAEAGGSAISRAFIIIEQATRAGGEDLEQFAEVAGMSAAQFAQAYQEDAAQAMRAFIEGLGRMQASGQDVFGTMRDLGMSEILLRDAMLRLAGAGDLVARSLDVGNDGWRDNTALLDEAERRYATVESRMLIARNNINDFAIDIGNTFLPALGEAADLVSSLGEVLADLPGPLKSTLAILGAIAAAVLLTGGTALIAVPQIAAYRQAVELLANSQGRLAAATVAANTAMSRTAAFLGGPWGLAIGTAIALLAAWGIQQANARARARQLTDTLNEQSGAVTRDTGLWVANELTTRGVIKNAERLGISAGDLTAAILGEADAVARVNAVLDQHQVTGSLTTDLMNGQTRAATSVREAMRELGGDLDNARDLHEQLNAAMEGSKVSAADLDPATRRLGDTLELTASQAKDLSGEIDNLEKEFRAFLGQLWDVEEAEDAAVQAMKRMTDAAKENGGALTGNSEAALTNRENVRNLIRAHTDQIAAMARSGATTEELTGKTQQLRDQFIRQARQAGLTESAILEYASAYDDVPSIISTTVTTPGMVAAQRQVQTYVQWLNSIPATVRTRVIAEQQTTRGGSREFNELGGPAGSRFAGGSMADGPHGIDQVPAWLTRGEWVSTVDATRRNRAALEAANAGATLAVVGSARAAVPSASPAGGAGMSPAQLASAVRAGLSGMSVQMDGRVVGHIQGRDADLLAR